MQYKTLDSLCKVASGGTPSRSKKEYWDGGDIPWIKIGNIKSKVVSNADEYITEAGLNNSSAKLFKKGTILYTIFATLGEVGILDFDACTNQAIAGISIEKPEEITTDYLYYYLKSKKAEVNQIGRGVAQNNINLSILRKFSIPLRDIEDQKTIVGFLNKVESIIEKQKRQLERLDELIKARFVEMFGNVVANDKGWPTEPISKAAPTSSPKIKNNETVWLLNLDMVESQSGKVISKLIVSEDKINASTCTFDENNVLYSKLRPYLNKVVLPDQEGYCTTELVPLRPGKELTREFLATLLRSDAFVGYINEKTAGAKMPRVSMNIFRQFECILPPIALQQQFSEFYNQVDKSKFAVQKKKKKTQLLFDSLMQEYFG